MLSIAFSVRRFESVEQLKNLMDVSKQYLFARRRNGTVINQIEQFRLPYYHTNRVPLIKGFMGEKGKN